MKTVTFTKYPTNLAIAMLDCEICDLPPVGYARLVRIDDELSVWIGRTDFGQYVSAPAFEDAGPVGGLVQITNAVFQPRYQNA